MQNRCCRGLRDCHYTIKTVFRYAFEVEASTLFVAGIVLKSSKLDGSQNVD